MVSEEEFKVAADRVKKLKVKPTNDELLKLYALFKQATEGDCNIARPGMFALKEKAKWDAWDGVKGMSASDAMQDYVSHVDQLVSTYGLEDA